ncbi:type III secretion system needle filament subunit SctF [Pseudomonas sp. MWU13-3659]|uniref:type III secretion system needle filament subunit SctF n=1 Tax=Pseudomonas sp. MWU13-3659 TaxID=2986964 RepID=UPI00256F57E5|nr:type III secretion system needle filament subunit SctF [Pseudomonas sp. MWU13-3659]
MAEISFVDSSAVNTMDKVAETLVDQAKTANKNVRDAIDALKAGGDDPSKLADLQHRINKWTVVYNINATVTQAFKGVMSAILQKV